MQLKLSKKNRIAFVMSPRIGDTLITMVVVRNLLNHGYRITVFSKHLLELAEWFPGVDIQPAIGEPLALGVLNTFDTVVTAYGVDLPAYIRAAHRQVLVLDEAAVYRQIKPMVEIQVDVCTEEFGLPEATKDNGLRTPDGVISLAVPGKVVIHPTASNLQKQWLPSRFLSVAKELRAKGYEPCFVVGPNEKEKWTWVEAAGFPLICHDTLDGLARWLVSASLFIGNDSGIAHLASNLGISVISLAMRRKIAKRWVPGWSISQTLTAPAIIPGRAAREASWKYLVTVRQVSHAVQAQYTRLHGDPETGTRSGATVAQTLYQRYVSKRTQTHAVSKNAPLT